MVYVSNIVRKKYFNVDKSVKTSNIFIMYSNYISKQKSVNRLFNTKKKRLIYRLCTQSTYQNLNNILLDVMNDIIIIKYLIHLYFIIFNLIYFI